MILVVMSMNGASTVITHIPVIHKLILKGLKTSHVKSIVVEAGEVMQGVVESHPVIGSDRITDIGILASV